MKKDPMKGKAGLAPIVHKRGDRKVFVLTRVVYGVRGHKPVLGQEYLTFYQAELAAEEANRKSGLTDEEAWLLIENTVMSER
jgi:hypothetical protein